VARDLAVERTDREEHLHQASRAIGLEQVEVAFDQRALGDDAHRITELPKHFEDVSRDPVLSFDWLIRIGIGSEGDESQR